MSNPTTTPGDDREAAEVLSRYEKAINGLSGLPATQTIVYKQVNYTPTTMAALLQGAAAPLQAVVNARSVLVTALNNRHAGFTAAVTLIDGFYGLLPNILPPGTDVSQFGAKAPKARKPLTVAQKEAANLKRQETRKARGIMGKKQRLAITAAATPAATTPATTPAATTTTTAG